MGVYDINCSCFYKRTLLIEGGIVLVTISLRGYLNKKKLILKIGYNNNEEKKVVCLVCLHGKCCVSARANSWKMSGFS